MLARKALHHLPTALPCSSSFSNLLSPLLVNFKLSVDSCPSMYELVLNKTTLLLLLTAEASHLYVHTFLSQLHLKLGLCFKPFGHLGRKIGNLIHAYCKVCGNIKRDEKIRGLTFWRRSPNLGLWLCVNVPNVCMFYC